MFDYFPLLRILICQIEKGKRLLFDILLFLKRSQQQHIAFQFLKGSAVICTVVPTHDGKTLRSLSPEERKLNIHLEHPTYF